MSRDGRTGMYTRLLYRKICGVSSKIKKREKKKEKETRTNERSKF